ncbi:Chitin synthase, class 3 [Maudiozyma exigua]|uniref:chitin synthase n=1 Tax=Maudiozyma exigua TaxID=34358 RepID=A0A9P6WC98_MAUEX|nr:Chitin synthase, class 3 [Kazachstania exigua]
MSHEEYYSLVDGQQDIELQSQDRRIHRHVTFKSNSSGSDVPTKKYIDSTREHPLSAWRFYCYAITWFIPRSLMKLCGMTTKDRRLAWREKIGLLSIILYIGILVTYLTFGLSSTLCNYSRQRLSFEDVSPLVVIINGKTYPYESIYDTHVEYVTVKDNTLLGPSKYSGTDISFQFQNVNGNCHGLIIPRKNCSIPTDSNDNIAWYFSCIANLTTTHDPVQCHLSETTRSLFYDLESEADIFYTWQQLKNDSRNLVVYGGSVLDLGLLNQLDTDNLEYPQYFKELQNLRLQGYDISLLINTNYEIQIARCLTEIIKVGEIESQTIGCIAADVVLYISLLLILSAVLVKFFIACYFHWVISKGQGATKLDSKSMQLRNKAIEKWSTDINIQGPIKLSNSIGISKRKRFSNIITNFTKNDCIEMAALDRSTIDTNLERSITTMSLQNATVSTMKNDDENESDINSRPMRIIPSTLNPALISAHVLEQPDIDYEPFDFPLIHALCLVTCYSEDETGLRTTLDSLATTDYPNSHKLLFVICDGLITGSGNDKQTPDIVLDMVEHFVIPKEEVKPHSYVAVASGIKRHNMAKVYAGFYKYDYHTVPIEKQQRVPMIIVVKCGISEEQLSSKPGNRGKRDSQIILMSFLQKLTFNERMTRLDFEILVNIWRVTGLMADFYESILMVDADTKIFPDSMTHMVAELVRDSEIMGLCGETKIANKNESWVTAIQVFEYYISHHQVKAFESVFCCVTCLPGCFSMYRIKSPKDLDGKWVPILINPDIIESYSDNNVSTLHKKNLLLLGEDRYLTSLMLKTFPRRKQIFVSKAACKTVVPSKFSVLLSQRRRWINSTVHNLFELALVKDLCGTFCFSMQFIIVIELIGTLVLPLAICFTLYVVCVAIFSPVTPTMTLCLLALILGLPGLLVAVTVSSVSYVLWLLVYIVALPIWNFILPSYAFWKFDDFSWGGTRKVAGEKGDHGHDDSNTDFEHSMIRMKTWQQFEKEMIIHGLPIISEQ